MTLKHLYYDSSQDMAVFNRLLKSYGSVGSGTHQTPLTHARLVVY